MIVHHTITERAKALASRATRELNPTRRQFFEIVAEFETRMIDRMKRNDARRHRRA